MGPRDELEGGAKSDEIVPTLDGAVAAAEQSASLDGTGAAGEAKEGASTEGEESAKQDGAVAAAEPSVPSATEIDAVLASGIAALEAQAKKELTDTVRQFMVDLTLPLGMRLTDFFEDGVNPCSMVTIVRSGGQCDAAGVEAGCKILSVATLWAE